MGMYFAHSGREKFQKCGISNNVDGTKDDYLWENDADHISSANDKTSGE
jgi:hypothetical protein